MLSPAISASGQPALDRMLSNVSVQENDRHCAIVKIGFHFPVQYVSYFPLASGSQLSVRLRPIDTGGSASALGRESLPAPQSAAANIADIDYEGDRPEGPTLTISFKSAMYFHIGQGRDFQSLLISVSDTAENKSCTPMMDDKFAWAAGAVPSPELRPSTATADRGAAAIMEPGSEERKILEQAKAALTANDNPRAIQLLTKFLQGPDNASMPEARELLGVARERNGQGAHAKAEYEQYLKDYPNSSGAGRVRQRLAALLSRALHPGETAGAPGEEPPSLRWETNASISEYFYHDEMSTTVRDEGSQIVVDNGLTALQSELVSAVDASVGVTGEDFQARLRASGSYTKDFLTGVNDRLRVSELYLEGSDASRTLFARIGRQYRSSGGVLGRIDGALLTVKASDRFKVDVVGGFPVDTTWSHFGTKRYAVGASVDYFDGPFSGDVYFLRQMNDGFVDRQSVGAEARYVNNTLSAFGTLDYDVHFNKINLALFTGNYMFADQTSINIAADYRRAPLLRTSDALIGQSFTALSDLLSTYTRAQIDRLALDRTAMSTSLFASAGHPLNEQFTVSLDGTLWNMQGMPASGGVPEIPATGTQYYFSGHLTGSSLISDGDLGMLSLGYSKMANSNRYTFDFNTRYPVTRELRIGPRIFFSYRDISSSGSLGSSGSEYVARPTLRLNYRFRPNVEFELDGGAEWQRDLLGSTTTKTWDYLVDFGVRIDY
ncbi:MAG TPA: hypothetical protein VG891_04730 [Rhizomicrobium sp.]|nr:hypothetical protein [Rhizomicrobium sp.]